VGLRERQLTSPLTLARATHPLPTLAVTALSTALAAAAGATPGDLAVLCAAVLVGQASIGWANDAIDAERDRLAGRVDKPVAGGQLRRGSVLIAAKVALLADVPLSLAIGWRAGAAHLAAVGWAWLYDVGVKATAWSWVPYVVSFGLLPIVIAGALPGGPLPRPLIVVVGSWCGVAAHFANTVGDAEEDARFGIRGLPQRIGEARSVLVAAVAVAAAAAALLAAVGAVALGLVACLGSIACAAATLLALNVRAGRRLAFRLVIAAVALLVAGFVGSGGAALTG
jgi:4-hydroxybenzoate polyprenyltransferase